MSSSSHVNTILQHPERRVAVPAEQPTDAPRLMIVIHHKALLVNGDWIAAANSAQSALFGHHPLKFLSRQVEVLKPLFVAITEHTKALPFRGKLSNRSHFEAPTTLSLFSGWINLILGGATPTDEAATLRMARRFVEKEGRQRATARTTTDLSFRQILGRRHNTQTQPTQNGSVNRAGGSTFGYNGFRQGVNLRYRFANWLGSFGVLAPCEPFA